MASKKFRSCFITGVEVNDDMIVLEDSVHLYWHIDRKACSPELVKSFKSWFDNIYMKGIPQTLTIFEYSIGTNADGESIHIVNKIYNGQSSYGVM